MPRQLSDYSEFLTAIHKTWIEETDFKSTPDFMEVMKEPRLVVAINHSTPLSWLPAMSALTLEAVKSGGGDRTPQGVVDKWFYSNPLTKIVGEYLSQSDHPQTFDELLANFSQAERTDLVVFPEGANTFFGDVHAVQEFRSSRFIELAIRAQAPILVVAHTGSENWSVPFQIPNEWIEFVQPFSKFFGEGLMKYRSLNLPFFLKRIPVFRVRCALYRPSLQSADLASDPQDRRVQIRTEAEKVRQMMIDLLKT